MPKTCCGNTHVKEDADRQIICTDCEEYLYDYVGEDNQ